MKKFFVLSVLFLFINPVCSADTIYNTKCTDLISDMQKARETVSNVLNLTEDQKKCKKTIDEKFSNTSSEFNIEKEITNIDQYDKEFRLILTKEQKRKLKDIRRMEKSALKACQKNKVYFKPDENYKPFGMK